MDKLINNSKPNKKHNGLFIVFLGRDGVGKSTLIESTCKAISPYFEQTLRFHLFTNTILPVRKGEDFSRAHDKPLRNKFLSLIKLLIFCLEYVAGYYLTILPAKKKNKIIVFDRYYYDLLADTKRYRHSLGIFWTKFFMKIIPKPDLIFIIDVPTSEILKRKYELTFEEHERLRPKYLQIEKMLDNCYIIQNNSSIEAASDLIARTIIESI